MSELIEITPSGKITKRNRSGNVVELYEIDKEDFLEFIYEKGKLLEFVEYLRESGKLDESECFSELAYKGKYIEGNCFVYNGVVINKEDYNVYRFKYNGIGRKFYYFYNIIKNYLGDIETIVRDNGTILAPAYKRLEGTISLLGNVELKEIYYDDWSLNIKFYLSNDTYIEFRNMPSEDEVVLILGRSMDYRIVADFLLNIDDFIDEAERLILERGYRPDGTGKWIKM